MKPYFPFSTSNTIYTGISIRLAIAAQIMAAYPPSTVAGATVDSIATWALARADALIEAEQRTRKEEPDETSDV